MGPAARWLRQSLRMGVVAAAASTLWATAQAQSTGGSAAAAPVFTQPFPQPSDLTPLSPDDVTVDLANSSPQPGSIFPSLTFPGREAYVKFKEDLYRDHGIQVAAFYSQLYQHASKTRPGAPYDSANGYWAGLLFRWTALDRGGDHEGSLVELLFETKKRDMMKKLVTSVLAGDVFHEEEPRWLREICPEGRTIGPARFRPGRGSCLQRAVRTGRAG